jgi:hypothetical protein
MDRGALALAARSFVSLGAFARSIYTPSFITTLRAPRFDMSFCDETVGDTLRPAKRRRRSKMLTPAAITKAKKIAESAASRTLGIDQVWIEFRPAWGFGQYQVRFAIPGIVDDFCCETPVVLTSAEFHAYEAWVADRAVWLSFVGTRGHGMGSTASGSDGSDR